MAMHMGGLVFGVSFTAQTTDDAKAAIHDIRMRALERRHDGVRGYLAELGAAGAVNYPEKLAEYEKLAAAEKANLTLETYRAANAFEGELAMAMVKAQGAAAMRAIALQKDRRDAKAVVAQRKLILLAISLAGSSLVFFAAMAGSSETPQPPSASMLGLVRARKRLAALRAGPEKRTA
jgi:hypothetical protein